MRFIKGFFNTKEGLIKDAENQNMNINKGHSIFFFLFVILSFAIYTSASSRRILNSAQLHDHNTRSNVENSTSDKNHTRRVLVHVVVARGSGGGGHGGGGRGGGRGSGGGSRSGGQAKDMPSSWTQGRVPLYAAGAANGGRHHRGASCRIQSNKLVPLAALILVPIIFGRAW